MKKTGDDFEIVTCLYYLENSALYKTIYIPKFQQYIAKPDSWIVSIVMEEFFN